MSPGFPSAGFDFVFSAMPILFILFFLVFIGIIVAIIGSTLKKNAYNRRQPVLAVSSRILAKRTNLTHHHGNSTDSMNHSHTSTTYYATFEVESGDRLELQLPASEFGLLIEGDYGKLTFQGTRYLGFVRDQQPATPWQPPTGTSDSGQSLTQP